MCVCGVGMVCVCGVCVVCVCVVCVCVHQLNDTLQLDTPKSISIYRQPTYKAQGNIIINVI